MLHILHDIEKELAVHLKDRNSWNSLYVDYHKPYVKRLWKQFGDYRIYLHEILPCEKTESLYHPHPWPSAMKVIAGSYEMGLGYSDNKVAPVATTKFILPANSYYEMDSPDAWHYVRPLSDSSFSLMITGMPWAKTTSKTTYPMRELGSNEKHRIFEVFEGVYKI